MNNEYEKDTHHLHRQQYNVHAADMITRMTATMRRDNGDWDANKHGDASNTVMTNMLMTCHRHSHH